MQGRLSLLKLQQSSFGVLQFQQLKDLVQLHLHVRVTHLAQVDCAPIINHLEQACKLTLRVFGIVLQQFAQHFGNLKDFVRVDFFSEFFVQETKLSQFIFVSFDSTKHRPLLVELLFVFLELVLFSDFLTLLTMLFLFWLVRVST